MLLKKSPKLAWNSTLKQSNLVFGFLNQIASWRRLNQLSRVPLKIVLQHGVIPGSSQTKAQGISSPGTYEASLMWPRNDGELRWNVMLDWMCR